MIRSTTPAIPAFMYSPILLSSASDNLNCLKHHKIANTIGESHSLIRSRIIGESRVQSSDDLLNEPTSLRNRCGSGLHHQTQQLQIRYIYILYRNLAVLRVTTHARGIYATITQAGRKNRGLLATIKTLLRQPSLYWPFLRHILTKTSL